MLRHEFWDIYECEAANQKALDAVFPRFHLCTKMPGVFFSEDDARFRRWNNFIGFSLEQASEMFLRDLPSDIQVNFQMNEDGSGRVYFEAPERSVFSLAGFNLVEKSMFVDEVELDSSRQGQGIARTIMRNQLEFMYLCGVERCHLTAGKSNGSYCWARFGFLPYDVSEDNTLFQDAFLKPVALLLDDLSEALPEDVRHSFTDAIALKKPRDLWELADKKDKFHSDVAGQFNQLSGYNQAQKKLLQDSIVSEKPVKLAHFLFSCTSWDGVFDFGDEAQLARAGEYAGGWQHLKPEA